MKYLFFATIFISVIISCNNSPDRPNPAMTQEQHDRVNAESAVLEAQKALTVPTTASVLHYTCPNNCAGSGGDTAGSCPVCGTTYSHNQAWHNQPTPATSAPATNAAGVYHYTCPQGCAGGASAQGTCSSCGTPLAHNTAFHN